MNIIKITNKIEVLGNGLIQVRELSQLVDDKNTVIEDLGFSRYVLTPDTDITTITDEKVKNIAVVTWTNEVIEAYKSTMEKIYND